LLACDNQKEKSWLMSSPVYYLDVQPRKISEEVLSPEVAQAGRFYGVDFLAPLNFERCTFSREVIFSRCVFHKAVSLKNAHFGDTARFYKCVFRGPVDFRWAAVELSEKDSVDACDNGEANVSWSRFEAPVNFYGARFHGPTVFWRPMFRDEVKLEGTRFDAAVTFQASNSQVCLEALDFAVGLGPKRCLR
jgi:pentapeptide repeat protein